MGSRNQVMAICRAGLTKVGVSIKVLNFRTPEIFVVSYLKFEQKGQTIEFFVQKM